MYFHPYRKPLAPLNAGTSDGCTLRTAMPLNAGGYLQKLQIASQNHEIDIVPLGQLKDGGG